MKDKWNKVASRIIKRLFMLINMRYKHSFQRQQCQVKGSTQIN